MRPNWIPDRDSLWWPLLAVVAVAAIYWRVAGHPPFVETEEVSVDFCDNLCAARGAGYALARSRREAIDAECASKGEDFEAGCADYFEERANEDIPDAAPDDDD